MTCTEATAHIGTKALNIRHQAQKGFRGIFVGIPHNQKVYLVYVRHKRKIISSYDFVLNEVFSSALAYTSQPYLETMAMCPSMAYIPCATPSKEQTGDTIMFAHFEEGDLLYENCKDAESDAESSDESKNDSIMTPLLSLGEPNALVSGNE